MTLKTVFKKANGHTVTAQLQLKKESTKTFGMKLKPATKKKYEPAATKKGRSFTPLSSPTVTKNQSTKKLKEVTATKPERRFAAAESYFVQPQLWRKQEMQHQKL